MSAIMSWLVGHEAVLAGLVVGVLDFVVSINPAAASNSVIEWILTEAKSLVSSVPHSSVAKKQLPKA